MNQSISSFSIISNNFPQFMRTDPRHTPDFDGVKTEEKIFCDTPTEFKITLGWGKTQLAWDRQATVSFDDFAEDLSQSPVGTKDGPCYTPAIFSGNKRNKQEAVEIGIAALDADCGHTLDEIIEALERAGLEAIVHSTYSHMATESEISCQDYDKWADAHPGRDVAAYMREKRSYLPRVAEGAKVVGKVEVPGKEIAYKYIVKHQPCPKFRVIVPLAGDWRAKDFENQRAANAAWRLFITTLAGLLGLQHDQACTDTSRLFFFPRTRQGGPEYQFRQVAGNACCMEQVLSQAPETEPRFRRANGHDNNADNGLGRISREWAAKNAPYFEVVTALAVRAPQVLLRQNGVKQTITCPFESCHSSPGGEGTFVVNASQLKEADLPEHKSGFVACCSHNACAERDRLNLLQGMLDNGWLDVADLTNPDFYASGFKPEPVAAEEGSEALVDKLNEQYAWLNDECVIFDLVHMTTRKKDQVADATASLGLFRDGKWIPAFTLWRSSKNRRGYAGRKFAPGKAKFITHDIKGKELGGTYVNIWQGWGCTPIKGDVSPLERLISRLCGGNKEEIEYLTWRLAIKVQKPWIKIPSYQVVVSDAEGTGKSQLGKFMVGLYGKHGKVVTDEAMESNFDDWRAAGLLFAVSEEVSFKNKRSVANKLKAMASTETSEINPKGKPSYQADNFLDLFFTANEHDAIYIRTAKERRPFIIEHPDTPVYSKADAHELQHWYDHAGKEAMLYYLMHEVDGNAFDPYEAAPETSGKEAMAEASRSPAEQFVHDLLGDASAGDPPQPFNMLLQSFIGDTGPYQKPIDKRMEQSLSRALGRARVPHKRVRIEREDEKKTVYAVADLDMWRVARDDEWAALKLQHPFF